MTIIECKKMLFKLAIRHGVAPKLISDRLLSKDDKQDMLQDHVTYEMLNCFVKVWVEYGMCNHTDGSMTPYKAILSNW